MSTPRGHFPSTKHKKSKPKMSLKINIETIPHEQHRYTTVGDWWVDKDGTIQIRVSGLSDWRREALIAVHELVEILLCKEKGISTETVDKFDKAFNYADHPDEEPGDEPSAPYVRQHCIATGVERLLAAELGVLWKDYEQELYALPEVPTKGE
jgi:hypothetical protein